MTNTEAARIDLKGYIEFYNNVEKYASYVKGSVPKHKTITKRIEAALNDKLGEIVEFSTGYRFDGTAYKYANSMFSLNKKSYGTGYTLKLHTERPQVTYSYKGETGSRRDSVETGRDINVPADIETSLSNMVELAQNHVKAYTEELVHLDNVEAEYNAIEKARRDFNDKYSYITREYFKIR